ncbi:MAG: hypothetical protein JXR96_07295 [Deltaproteobacteria bacterium]|nr:hypothetical protein [Deltaproteobacteria bacterium]
MRSWRSMALRSAALMVLCALAASHPWLAGCSVDDPEITSGRDFPFERAVALKKGNSTKKDAEDLLGPPFRKSKLSERVEAYRYFSKQVVVHRIFYFIPYRSDITEKELVLTFHGAFLEKIEKNVYQYEAS